MAEKIEDLAYLQSDSLEETDCNLCHSRKSGLILIENSFRILRCANCGLVYVSPRPNSKDLERFYEKYFPDNTEELWDKQMQYIFKKEGLSYIKRYKSNGNVLDIGCGYGFFLRLIKENGFNACGVELSSKAVEFARANLGLNIKEGRLGDAGFPDGYFDIVTLWYVLEHIPDPMEHLFMAHRLLKEKGLLLIRVPNMNINIDRILYRLGSPGKRFFLINPPRHLYDYSPSLIKKMLDKSNFKVKKIINSFPRTTFNILEMFRRYTWYFLSQAIFYLSGGRILTGSSITIYAQR